MSGKSFCRDSKAGSSNRHRELNRQKGGRQTASSKIGLPDKGLGKALEIDGQKTPAMYHDVHDDLSHLEAREETFKNFPKKHLVEKIVRSGYFYSGEDDKTICYCCNATVFAWNEKDDPAAFHEAHCKFHRLGNRNSEESTHSLEGASLLDTPITGASDVSPPPVVLQPTIAPTSPSAFKGESTNSVPIMTRDLQQNRPRPKFGSLPAFGNGECPEAVAPTVVKQFLEKKKFPTEIAEVVDPQHKALLESLNLSSEADRLKSFSEKDCWEFNTNNVLPSDQLAKEGFYYLGNLDRTQCFSCCKVFTMWQRKDNIQAVHRKFAADCRMVLGEETRNVAILNFLSTRDLSLPHAQFHQDTIVSNTLRSISPHLLDSNESTLEISPVPLLLHDFGSQRSQNSVSPTPSGVNDPAVPIDQAMEDLSPQPSPVALEQTLLTPLHPVLAVPGSQLNVTEPTRSAVLQPPQSFASGSLSDPNESSVAISANSLPMQSHALPQHNLVNHGSSAACGTVPVVQEQAASNEMPLDLRVPRSTSYAPQNLDHQSRSVLPAMEAEVIPVQVSMESEEQQQDWDSNNSETEISPPSHLGQTTLYNGNTGSPRQDVFFQQTAPSTSQGEWAEAFPCEEPDVAHMSRMVDRLDTFDYTWNARGISFTDEMARAGFYAIGEHAKCWYCGGCVYHWNSQDDPWEKHARLYPNCEYLLQQKGPDFVADVSSSRHRAGANRAPTPVPRFMRSPSVASNSSESPYSSLEEPYPRPFHGYHLPRMFPNRQPSPPRVVDPRQQEARRKQMIRESLDSDLTVTAIEMGFDVKVIKRAIKRKVRSTDSPFPSQDALLDALLNPPDESESSESEDEAPTPAPTSNVPGTSTSNLEIGEASEVTNPVAPHEEEGNPQTSSLEGAEHLDPKKLDEKLREYEQEKRCKVCLDRDAEVVFVPCGHLCTCVQCANALRTCPLCRKRIQTAMKIYTS